MPGKHTNIKIFLKSLNCPEGSAPNCPLTVSLALAKTEKLIDQLSIIDQN